MASPPLVAAEPAAVPTLAAPPARVRLQLSAPLSGFAGGVPEVDGEGGTVGEALRRFADSDERVRAYLYNSAGRFRPTVAIFLNGRDIRALDGAETALHAGDLLTLLPARAGG